MATQHLGTRTRQYIADIGYGCYSHPHPTSSSADLHRPMCSLGMHSIQGIWLSITCTHCFIHPHIPGPAAFCQQIVGLQLYPYCKPTQGKLLHAHLQRYILILFCVPNLMNLLACTHRPDKTYNPICSTCAGATSAAESFSHAHTYWRQHTYNNT